MRRSVGSEALADRASGARSAARAGLGRRTATGLRTRLSRRTATGLRTRLSRRTATGLRTRLSRRTATGLRAGLAAALLALLAPPLTTAGAEPPAAGDRPPDVAAPAPGGAPPRSAAPPPGAARPDVAAPPPGLGSLRVRPRLDRQPLPPSPHQAGRTAGTGPPPQLRPAFPRHLEERVFALPTLSEPERARLGAGNEGLGGDAAPDGGASPWVGGDGDRVSAGLRFSF